MDPEIKAMLDAAYAQDDAAKAAYERHQWQREREQMKKRSSDDLGLVYKTTYTPTVQPVQQASVWDSETEKRWTDWVDGRVIKQFEEGGTLFELFAEIISLIRCELRKEFNEQLASLRADMNVQTGIARGEIKELKRNVS